MRQLSSCISVGLFLVLSGCSVLQYGSLPRHGVLLEVWRDLPGDRVSDLTDSSGYAGAADEIHLLESFESPIRGQDYGAVASALIVPPEDGDYTFWIASDDEGQLWLGPDENEQGLRRIARVVPWTGEREWEKRDEQCSGPIGLEKGKRYFLRAFQKQGGGGNHLAVAWRGPGFERRVITAEHLRLPELGKDVVGRIAATRRAEKERKKLLKQVKEYATAGDSLPMELTSRFSLGGQASPENDTGINVLIDQAHQTQFRILWGMRGEISNAGFRACTSVASLSSVLTPGHPSRIRIPVDGMDPFAWWPTPEFNVLVTHQADLNAQSYVPEEREAVLRFVESGGGLLVLAARPGDRAAADGWSMNRLLEQFGAGLSSQTENNSGMTVPVLELNDDWEILVTGKSGRPVRARRIFGKGRIMICENPSVLAWNKKSDDSDTRGRKARLLSETLVWLAEGKAPIGGDWRMPRAGGVSIFPELERNLGGVVVYYAGNQKPEVIECIEKHIPRAADQVRKWLPTKQFDEPYTIVICAGGGGGWAINGRPKAAAVISYDSLGILGIFAHEMAHTMGGPRNALGELAGISPHHNQGESHAGWFQGKIQALFSGRTDQANRNCNRILELEKKKGSLLDLATEHQTKAGRAKWGKGPEWTKIWWISQKLDDRYGPTWYPRWYWVRSTRWMHEPGHRETWDEMVEDMSIAVGEDLFPFFRKIGTSLEKERLERIEFQGEILELPVAPLGTGPAGNVCLEPIGDYTQPLRPLR